MYGMAALEKYKQDYTQTKNINITHTKKRGELNTNTINVTTSEIYIYT